MYLSETGEKVKKLAINAFLLAFLIAWVWFGVYTFSRPEEYHTGCQYDPRTTLTAYDGYA
jgi:hypothetical protein